MKQLTTRANRPLPHPQTLCSVLEHPPPPLNPPPPSMEVTVYSIEDGKRLGLDYGLEGAGGGVDGGACLHPRLHGHYGSKEKHSMESRASPLLSRVYQICKKG